MIFMVVQVRSGIMGTGFGRICLFVTDQAAFCGALDTATACASSAFPKFAGTGSTITSQGGGDYFFERSFSRFFSSDMNSLTSLKSR